MKKSWAKYLILLNFLLLTSTNINISSTYAKDVFQEETQSLEQVEPVQETEEVQAIEEPIEEVQQEIIEETEEEKEKKKQEEIKKSFFQAVHKADVNKALELIAQGADVNSKDDSDCSPLFLASVLGYTEMVATLIQAGADVNLLAYNSASLEVAIIRGYTDIVQMLINAGAKTTAIYDAEGKLLIPPAITFLPQIQKPSNTFNNVYNSILIKLLLSGANPNVSHKEIFNEETFMTPLMTAVCLGNLEAVSLLIACGADVNFKTKKGLTAYICAKKTNQPDMLEILKEAGTKIKKVSKKAKYPDLPTTEYVGKMSFIPGFGPTTSSDDPLNIISACEEKEITDINVKDESGETILMRLLRNYNHSEEYIKFLVQSGIDVNLENNEGETALLITSNTNMQCISSLETLLKGGANVNVKDKDGKTPLIRYIGVTSSCYCSMCYSFTNFNRYHEIIKLLIAAGADINAQDADGKTPLMYAFYRDSAHNIFSLTKILLEFGADPTIKDKDGLSFLDMLEGKTPAEEDNKQLDEETQSDLQN
ncbi:MAG: ankyrin repeat domain-containing protein [Blastocatellia bacterium]